MFLTVAVTWLHSIDNADLHLLQSAIQEYLANAASEYELKALTWLPAEVEDAVAVLVQQLQELSRFQLAMNGVRRPALANSEASLLAHIIACLIDPSSGELNVLKRVRNPLLQIASAGIGLLSAGIGKLGLGVRSASPTASGPTAETVVVFVPGGVSHRDLRLLHQAVSGQSSKRVILVSNCITSPDLLLQDALSFVSELC